jgi:hypothetical protein
MYIQFHNGHTLQVISEMITLVSRGVTSIRNIGIYLPIHRSYTPEHRYRISLLERKHFNPEDRSSILLRNVVLKTYINSYDLVNDAVSSADYRVSNDNVERNGRGLIKVLFWSLPSDAEKYHEDSGIKAGDALNEKAGTVTTRNVINQSSVVYIQMLFQLHKRTDKDRGLFRR